jgi:hypothetical protein
LKRKNGLLRRGRSNPFWNAWRQQILDEGAEAGQAPAATG